ncbi:hypothetical protein KA005_58045 [bacterium]|nr:hypothetical protein [bacterium]
MEINKSHDIEGLRTIEAIPEGRGVLLTTNPGFPTDLTCRLANDPGAKTPDNLAEAARAHYLIAWQQNNVDPPIIAWPGYAFAMRQTFDMAGNLPLTNQTVYMTYPGLQEGCAISIPSGTFALGYTGVGGEFTLPSGCYMYNVAMQVPGTRLRVANTATDGAVNAGLLAVPASGTTELYEVSRFNATTFALTVRPLP